MGSRSSISVWIEVLKFIRYKKKFRNKDLLEELHIDRGAVSRITSALVGAGFYKVVKSGTVKVFYDVVALNEDKELFEEFKELRKKSK